MKNKKPVAIQIITDQLGSVELIATNRDEVASEWGIVIGSGNRSLKYARRLLICSPF